MNEREESEEVLMAAVVADFYLNKIEFFN